MPHGFRAGALGLLALGLLAMPLIPLTAAARRSRCWVNHRRDAPELVDQLNELLYDRAKAVEGRTELPDDPLRGYTAHSCMGSFYSNRACKFSNLYFNIITQTLEYYVCLKEPRRNVLMGHERSSENFTVAGTVGDKHLTQSFMRRTFGDKKEDLYKIIKVRGDLPPADEVLDVDGTSMLWPGVMHFRYGHVWVDNLYPMFMHLMNFDDLDNADDFKIFLLYKNTTIFSQYATSLSKQRVELLDKYGKRDREANWIRFKTATVPSREYRLSAVPDNQNRAMPPTLSYSTVWWHFRQHTYRSMGIKGNIRPKKHKIVLNVGLGKRSIYNVEETMICIKQNFPESEVQAVTFHALDFEQQLQLLSETTVFITTEGSPGFRMLFLPRGASVILLGSPMFEKSSRSRNAPFHESDRWLDWVTYINILRYPVSIGSKDEYVFRYDRSKHEKLSDKQVHDKSYWYLWKVYDADIVVKCDKIIPLIAQSLIESTLGIMNRM